MDGGEGASSTRPKRATSAFFKRTLTDDFSFVQFDGQLYSRQDMLDQFAGGGTDLHAL